MLERVKAISYKSVRFDRVFVSRFDGGTNTFFVMMCLVKR